MSEQKHDQKETQRRRVLEYVKQLLERGEIYRGRTAAEYFDAQTDPAFWTQEQIDRFILEGKIGFLREIVNSIPPEGGKEETKVEPLYAVVRESMEGRDHTYEPEKKLSREDWYDKIAEALNTSITYKNKARAHLETAKKSLPAKDFAWLTKKLAANPTYQLLLDIDQTERSSVNTDKKRRNAGA
jgi:hypothetical protein